MSDITKNNATWVNKTKVKWDNKTPLRGITPVTISQYQELEDTLDELLKGLNEVHKTSTFAHGIVTTQKAGFMSGDQLKTMKNLLLLLEYIIIEAPTKMMPANMIVGTEETYTVDTLPNGWIPCDKNNTEENFSEINILGASNASNYEDHRDYANTEGTDLDRYSVSSNFLEREY